MATTNVPVTTIARTGTQILTSGATAAASGDGNNFVWSPNTWVILENAGAATNVVATFVTQDTVEELAISDLAISLAANDRQAVRPLSELYKFKSGTDIGRVVVTWAGTLTNATIRVISY